MSMKKLELNAHRNTIVSTDNRTGTDTSQGDYFDFDNVDLTTSTDLDEIELGQKKQSAGAGNGRKVKNTEPTASSDSGKGADDMSPWEAGRFDVAQIKHVAECLGIDTVGLEFRDMPPNLAKLAKSFSQRNDDGEAVSGTGWSKSALQAPTGKRSFVVNYVSTTKKLSIEGSNAMHHQGHNVVASGDMTMVAYSMVHATHDSQQFKWSASMGYQIAHGCEVEVTRIDVFLLLRVPDGVSKAEFINALAFAGLHAGVDTSLYTNESVYFNQSSQSEALKIYDTEAELRRARKGGLPTLPGIEELLDINKRTVRLECVFRAKRLVQIAKAHGGRAHPCLFTKELLAEMVLTLLQKLAMNGNIFRRLEIAELQAIPLPYRSTFAHWQNGEVLSDMVKSERVLKEHKTFLKTHFNFNLNKPYTGTVREPMSLAEILEPSNFIPVPNVIRNNPELFYQIDMEEERRDIKKRGANGISSVVLDPYRAPDTIIMLNGEPRVI